jgi:hypothetical protein
MGQIVNCEYVCGYINRKWGLSIVPVAGTEKQAANMEYVLRMVDLANSKRGTTTTYGTGSYATKQAADTVAANACIQNLIVVKMNYVVAGSSGFAYSEDGVTWTAKQFGYSWAAVAYGSNFWIMGGYDQIAKIKNVKEQSIVEVEGQWNGVFRGNGEFVAVAGMPNVETDGKTATSTTGDFWTTRVMAGDWRAITYGTNRLVAVGSGKIATCPDGGSWTVQNIPGAWTGVDYDFLRWVAVGSGKIATSTDGVNWSVQNIPGDWLGVTTTITGVWVAVGSGKIATSTDGVNWAVQDVQELWVGVAYGNGRLVAVTEDHKIGTSTDGVNWAVQTVWGAGNNFYGVAARH